MAERILILGASARAAAASARRAGLEPFAIDLFAAESAVLRAAALAAHGDAERAALAAAMAQSYLAAALPRMEETATRLLAHCLAGDELRGQLALLRRFTRRLPPDTIALNRTIAAAVSSSEGYPLRREDV